MSFFALDILFAVLVFPLVIISAIDLKELSKMLEKLGACPGDGGVLCRRRRVRCRRDRRLGRGRQFGDEKVQSQSVSVHGYPCVRACPAGLIAITTVKLILWSS